ncbi:ecotin [Haloferula luteola]|uniref:Ecotin n=1 Tax=Haloferula luteola TaxID=595692 RepID=A0A840V5U5_9BACT|nr:ecotin family protein [Haloferula luteola]MBB5350158.1 ecotin [Haloferula luteola]
MKTLMTLGWMGAAACATAAEPLEAFPKAEEGMSRWVLRLPEREDAGRLRVEVVVGKLVMTDGVNRHFYGGSLESRTVEGWGYDYWILPELGPMIGTRMAPPEGAPKVETFVTLGGDPVWFPYQSQLPVVLYVPEGCEVRYRIWTAPEELEPVPEG